MAQSHDVAKSGYGETFKLLNKGFGERRLVFDLFKVFRFINVGKLFFDCFDQSVLLTSKS